MSEQSEPSPKPSWFSMLRAGKLLPVNKRSSEDPDEKRLPQITDWRTIVALGALRSVVKNAFGNLKPTYPPGRNERFEALIQDTLDGSPLVAEIREQLDLKVRATVLESFGKPTLVSFDLLFIDPENRIDELFAPYLVRDPESSDGKPSMGVLASDLFDRAVDAVWNNPEMAPVAIRGRVVVVSETQDLSIEGSPGNRLELHPGETLLFDMRDLGYIDEITRVSDLYVKHGPPAFDPAWRP